MSKGVLPETAAARIGIPVSVLRSWLTLGSKNNNDVYQKFAERIDLALVEFQCRLLDIISDSAFTKQNVNAAQWLYAQRFGKKEQAILEAQAKLDVEGVEAKVREYSPEEIAAAEARALAAANPPETKRKMNFGLEEPKVKH